MSGVALDMTLDDLIKQNKKPGGGGSRGRGRGSGAGPSRRFPNRAANRAAPYAAAKVRSSFYLALVEFSRRAYIYIFK